MNDALSTQQIVAELPALQALLTAYARPAERRHHALIWLLDQHLAAVIRRRGEPLMAQIRLAWWRDALAGPALAPEHRTDMVEALRGLHRFEDLRSHLIGMIDGWEALAVYDGSNAAAMLGDYAQGRGAGLFAALAPERKSAAAGQVWALWDLAGHVDGAALADAAIARAGTLLEEARAETRSLPRMPAMMIRVACGDVAKGKAAPRILTAGLYARLLRAQFFKV